MYAHTYTDSYRFFRITITLAALTRASLHSACPFSLHAYNCGHSFCALCLIRWFFSSLHGCGCWHDLVSCPLCRSQAVDPAPDPPRQNALCPFIPNRLVDNVVNNMVEKLKSVVENTAVGDERHDTDHIHERSKAKNAPLALPSELSEWGKCGQKRSDWAEKAACVVLLLFLQYDSASLTELRLYLQTWPNGDVACHQSLG